MDVSFEGIDLLQWKYETMVNRCNRWLFEPAYRQFETYFSDLVLSFDSRERSANSILFHIYHGRLSQIVTVCVKNYVYEHVECAAALENGDN